MGIKVKLQELNPGMRVIRILTLADNKAYILFYFSSHLFKKKII